MRTAAILFVSILMVSCNESKEENKKTDLEPSAKIERTINYDWLVGKWKRVDEEAGKETFENWQKSSETAYSGIGFTMQNGDTISQEIMQLYKVDNRWDVTVKVSEEAEKVLFKGISHDENEFICENTENDFPNTIKYWKNGKRIEALIYGGGMEISFEFERIE